MFEIVAAFLGALGISSTIGFFLFRSSARRGRSRLFQIIVGGGVLIFVLPVAFIVLWVVGLNLPSTDEVFGRNIQISIEFERNGVPLEKATLQFKASVPDYEDLTVRYSLGNTSTTNLLAEILVPSSEALSLRTNDLCTASTPVHEGRSSACSSQVSNRSLNVRWFATPGRAGVFTLVLSSASLRLEEYPSGTTAHVSDDLHSPSPNDIFEHDNVCEYRHADGRLWEPGTDRHDISCVAVQLDESRTSTEIRVGRFDTVGIDVAKGEVSFDVEVLTTLGISRGAYSWLALLGAVASGLLGSGWLWKFIDARRSSREQNQ